MEYWCFSPELVVEVEHDACLGRLEEADDGRASFHPIPKAESVNFTGPGGQQPRYSAVPGAARSITYGSWGMLLGVRCEAPRTGDYKSLSLLSLNLMSGHTPETPNSIIEYSMKRKLNTMVAWGKIDPLVRCPLAWVLVVLSILVIISNERIIRVFNGSRQQLNS